MPTGRQVSAVLAALHVCKPGNSHLLLGAQVAPASHDGTARIDVYCVEPSMVLFANLIMSRQHFMLDGMMGGAW